MPKKRWQRPVLHDHSQEDHEHRVTWLELFYDLIFVITIAQLTHHLAEHITLQSILEFVFLFIPVWWAWIGMTFYSDRFETDDISQRLFTFLSIVGVASLSYYIPDAFGSGATGFVLSYTFIRTILVILWFRAGVYNMSFRPHSRRYLAGFIPSIAIWLISLYFPAPSRYILWGIGLFIEYITPLTTIRMRNREVPSLNKSPHLPERFGLFMIIVLGESVVGAVSGLSALPQLTLQSLLVGSMGVAFVFMIWWLYFDHINERKIKPGTGYLAGWSYGHLPLVMSVAALGAGILHVIAQTGNTLDTPTLWLISGTVAVALFSMGILELTLQKKEHTPCSSFFGKFTRFGGGLVCLALPFIPIAHRPLPLLSILVFIFALEIFQGEASPEHDHDHNDPERAYLS